MQDANTKALNKYLEKQEAEEICLKYFIDSIDNDLIEIKKLVDALKVQAKDYDGYDFTEALKEMLNDTVL